MSESIEGNLLTWISLARPDVLFEETIWLKNFENLKHSSPSQKCVAEVARAHCGRVVCHLTCEQSMWLLQKNVASVKMHSSKMQMIQNWNFIGSILNIIYWDFGILSFWVSGILEFWVFRFLGFWNFGIWSFWDFGVWGFRDLEFLGFWDFGILSFWVFWIFGLWDFGILGFEVFGFLGFWDLGILLLKNLF